MSSARASKFYADRNLLAEHIVWCNWLSKYLLNVSWFISFLKFLLLTETSWFSSLIPWRLALWCILQVASWSLSSFFSPFQLPFPSSLFSASWLVFFFPNMPSLDPKVSYVKYSASFWKHAFIFNWRVVVFTTLYWLPPHLLSIFTPSGICLSTLKTPNIGISPGTANYWRRQLGLLAVPGWGARLW